MLPVGLGNIFTIFHLSSHTYIPRTWDLRAINKDNKNVQWKYINNVAQTLIRIFPACYVFAFETNVFLVREECWLRVEPRTYCNHDLGGSHELRETRAIDTHVHKPSLLQGD